MGDYLDRMDSLFGYNDPVTYTNEELKKYNKYTVPHYYEIRLGNGIEVSDCGPTTVYEDMSNHKKYKMSYEGLELFGSFRFDYFMISLNPDKGHFKRMVIDRMKNQKKAAYNEYRSEAARLDRCIADVDAMPE